MRVAFQQVVKKYGHVTGVDCLDLEIRSGEFIVLLGPSGCGKTTTLRMLAGLEAITSGAIHIGERCVNDTPPRDRDVAMVFQSYALYPHMTVRENIAYPLRVRKISRDQIRPRVESVAALLGIAGLLERRPKELSGGQRQRVALARAIVRQPSVFLMDEPLSNLDAKLRLYMRGELKRLQYELGTTTLYVTHDQAEAMTLAHKVAVMDGGKLQQFDTPLTIYHRPANKFVAGFLGSPGMNFVEGRVDHQERKFVSPSMEVPLSPPALDALRRRDRIVLGVRPENVRLSPVALPGGTPARIYVAEALGNETFVFLSLGGDKIVARSEGTVPPAIETAVWVTFDEAAIHFFDPDSGVRVPVVDAKASAAHPAS
ncbi:MAG: ABC transporter ATP-binding protein [Bryobacteraceae bacterium]